MLLLQDSALNPKVCQSPCSLYESVPRNLFLLFLNTLSSSLPLDTLFRSQFVITAHGILQSPQLSQSPQRHWVVSWSHRPLLSTVEVYVFCGCFLIKYLSPPLDYRLHGGGSVFVSNSHCIPSVPHSEGLSE